MKYAKTPLLELIKKPEKTKEEEEWNYEHFIHYRCSNCNNKMLFIKDNTSKELHELCPRCDYEKVIDIYSNIWRSCGEASTRECKGCPVPVKLCEKWNEGGD